MLNTAFNLQALLTRAKRLQTIAHTYDHAVNAQEQADALVANLEPCLNAPQDHHLWDWLEMTLIPQMMQLAHDVSTLQKRTKRGH